MDLRVDPNTSTKVPPPLKGWSLAASENGVGDQGDNDRAAEPPMSKHLVIVSGKMFKSLKRNKLIFEF